MIFFPMWKMPLSDIGVYNTKQIFLGGNARWFLLVMYTETSLFLVLQFSGKEPAAIQLFVSG
jgi:hypothetical protein